MVVIYADVAKLMFYKRFAINEFSLPYMVAVFKIRRHRTKWQAENSEAMHVSTIKALLNDAKVELAQVYLCLKQWLGQEFDNPFCKGQSEMLDNSLFTFSYLF